MYKYPLQDRISRLGIWTSNDFLECNAFAFVLLSKILDLISQLMAVFLWMYFVIVERTLRLNCFDRGWIDICVQVDGLISTRTDEQTGCMNTFTSNSQGSRITLN
jgi:hypothetical protein